MRSHLTAIILTLSPLAVLSTVNTGCSLFDDDKKDRDDDEDKEKETKKYERIRDECELNMKSIKTAQIAHDAEFDQYIETSFHPDSSPGKDKRDFTKGSAFDTLGWKPDDAIYGSYKLTTTSFTDFTVTCITDADADGKQATWTATKTRDPKRTTDADVY